MPHNNHKYRRMLRRLPDQMTTLIGLCNRDVVVMSHHAGSMGWRVDFRIEETDFRLEYDRGFLVVVKDPEGEAKVIGPDKGTWSSESLAGLAAAIMEDPA
jgi:hypothetical protein